MVAASSSWAMWNLVLRMSTVAATWRSTLLVKQTAGRQLLCRRVILDLVSCPKVYPWVTGRTPRWDSFALRTFGLSLPRFYKAVIHT
jgi:hypothetical protein